MAEMKNKINWSLWLSVVAIILSIFSFFISEGTLQFDSVNFIIGVLAILVTFLLGWQIYNSIDINRKIEIVRSFQKDIEITNDKINKLYSSFERKAFETGDFFGYTYMIILKMRYTRNEDEINSSIEILKRYNTNNPPDIRFGMKVNKDWSEFPKNIREVLIKEIEEILKEKNIEALKQIKDNIREAKSVSEIF